MLYYSFFEAAALSSIFVAMCGIANAHPAHQHRRDDGSMDAEFSSMFAAGEKEAAQHADGSTSDNMIIEKFLWSLNNMRYQHDAPPVYWNTTLWEFATDWASKCPSEHSVSMLDTVQVSYLNCMTLHSANDHVVRTVR